ncbi:MAG TPA: class I SAM-dependent methyltransferase [Candidatus Aminicenantes bacterium]|nr:class I SAM-dependent methyltransferase [Candidatus Aminicenantes bacterium]
MIINKSIEVSDLQRISFIALIEDFERLRSLLNSKGLLHTSFLGDFQPFHCAAAKGRTWPERALWRYWEMCMVIEFSGVSLNSKVLGVGESSTLLSFYLASRGATVFTIDLNQGLVDNANHVAEIMNWNLVNAYGDAQRIEFPENMFDQVISVCVIEHIENQELAIREMARVLKPGGVLSMTFDYGYREPGCNGFMSPAEVEERIIRPSGLEVIGNRNFVQSPWQEEGWKGAWGAIFLRKPIKGKVGVSDIWADQNECSRIQQEIWRRLGKFSLVETGAGPKKPDQGNPDSPLPGLSKLRQEDKRSKDLFSPSRRKRGFPIIDVFRKKFGKRSVDNCYEQPAVSKTFSGL